MSDFYTIQIFTPFTFPIRSHFRSGHIFNPVKSIDNSFINFYKINSDENSNFVELFNIQSLPTLLFFKDGIIFHKHSGVLSKEEYALVKKHPETGHDILQQSPQMSEISKNILNHHERWDGKGYPYGLSGENIPLISRILTAADAFDAMTHDRPYRDALSLDEAKLELIKGSNSQFDENVVKALLSVIN